MTLHLEVLHVPDCQNLAPMLDRLHLATDAAVTTREIDTDEEAAAAGMAGSPTLLINGVDPFAESDHCECGLSCRLYRDDQGRIVPAPSVDQLRSAIASAASASKTPAEVLSAWRTQALPLDDVERAVHQEILRTFAATGGPQTSSALEPITAGSGRTTADVLAALHDADAIRLTPSGGVAVAYPFSATPTRHRVRIESDVDVYAMCAIDALGIAPMVGRDTLIESVDATTDERVTVVMGQDATTWEPPAAVVFVGAETCGGPSADCCCDYLNFFADISVAEAWSRDHAHVPGEILTQAEAVALAVRLFQPLLSD